jgi:selenocysteine lyase/cysteine desulfurase
LGIPYALVLGFGAAVTYEQSVGVARASARALGLANHLRSRLAALDGVRLLDRGRDPCAIVTLDVAGHDAVTIVSELHRRHINASASLAWYGLIDMVEKQSASAVRLSPHYYNTLEEIDSAVEAIDEIICAAR